MMIRAGWGWLLGVACLGGVAVAEAPAPVLQGKGLRKAGAYYILPAETEVAKLADSVRGLQKGLVAAVMRQQAIDAQADANKKLVVGYTQQRRQLRQQLPLASSVGERNQIIETMNELGDRITLLTEGSEGDQAARKEAAAAVAERREAFLQRVLDVGNLIAETDKKYAELAADPDVQAAIEALGENPKTKAALGPSRTYLNHVKALKKAQGAVQSETIPLREDNGTFEVDVTLNGKVTRAMTFDTGAGIISLPADLAAKAGLKPSEDDPTIHLTTADGRTHEGKLMTLKSVRVGKFTVENVECAVMPASLANAPPLLGGSFLKYFTYKLVPEAGKLTLSKVATPEAEKHPAPEKHPARGGKKGATKGKAASKGDAAAGDDAP